jgi:hypothetical protein
LPYSYSAKFFRNNRHVLKKWVIISAIPACIPLVAPSKKIEFVPIAPTCQMYFRKRGWRTSVWLIPGIIDPTLI